MKEKYKNTLIIPAAIVALFSLGIYYSVLNANFVNLDDIEVVSNLFDSHDSINLSLFFRDNVGRYYRPLVISSLIIDFNIWQLEPSGYHLTNYLLHAINALLFWLTLSRLQGIFNFKNQAVTAGCALLFALHPLTCESVAWISGRTDIIASFFCLAGFCYYIYDYRCQSFVVPLCLLLGLWAKENALVLIPVLLITDFALIKYKTADSRQAAYSVFKWIVIFTIPLLIYFYMRMGGLSQLDHGIKMSLADKSENVVNPEVNNHLHTVNYLINMATACGFYLKKLFIPFPLNFAIVKIALIPYFILFIFLSLLSLVLFFLKKPWVLFWLGLLIISFSPALLVATSKMAWMPFAERYLYLSCLVWATAIFFTANSWISRKQHERTVFILMAIIICVWSVSTFNRISVWQDDKSLWTATRHDSPDSAKVMFKYASVLSSRGQGKEAQELLEKAAKKINDRAWKSYILLALADKAAQDKETDKAGGLIKQAFAAQHNIYTYEAMANYLLNAGSDYEKERKEKTKEAVEYFRILYSIKQDPFYLYQIVKIYRNNDPHLLKLICQEIINNHPKSKYAVFSRKILNKYSPHGASNPIYQPFIKKYL